MKTLKNLRQSPILLWVNLPGLAIGIFAFLLLMAYVLHETSFDTHFSTKDRVVRLYNSFNEKEGDEFLPICIREAYTTIPQQVPEIESAVQIYRGWSSEARFNNKPYKFNGLLFVDSTFFNVFGLELTLGETKTALNRKGDVVISQSLAKKIGCTGDCLGQPLKVDDMELIITGIIADLPQNTHFSFDMLVSMETEDLRYLGGCEFFTYYLLKPNTDFEMVSQKISKLNNDLMTEKWKEMELKPISGIEKLTDIHLYTPASFDLSPKGSLTQIYVVALLAFFILLIAVVNYINLFILSGEKRAMEIGMRKTSGASLADLWRLFYTETTLLTVSAFLLGLLGVYASLESFSELMNSNISISVLWSVKGLIFMVISFLFLILISGSYPSFYLSRIPVIGAIKGGSAKVVRKSRLSAAMVFIQFTISVFLLVSVLVVFAQLSHLKNVPLGFSPQNVVGIYGFNKEMSRSYKAMEAELLKLSYVQSAGSSGHFMGGGASGQYLHELGKTESKGYSVSEYRILKGFCETLQLQLVEGKFFSGTVEDKSSILLNETAVNEFGLTDALGKQVVMHCEPLTIIGIIRDFYYSSHAGEKIQPLALTAYSSGVNVMYLKMSGEFTVQQKTEVAEILRRFNPEYILSAFNLSDSYASKFRKEDRFLTMLLLGTLLAIFLSFMGMFALSAYNAESRTKEIGIRKVVGSSTVQVVFRMLLGSLKWVLLAMPPAFVASYLVLEPWLSTFANRIAISPFYFLAGGFAALVIASLAVFLKSWQAARQNPVESLRSE